jgi:hypothetical protein
MGKANKQGEAVNHIQELLTKRGLDIRSRKLTLEDDQHWVIYELNRLCRNNNTRRNIP